MAAPATALLLIDLQAAFCDAKGSMASQGRDIHAMQEAARAGNLLAIAARRAGVVVIWTKMMFAPDYADGGLLTSRIRPNLARIGALRRGGPDVELSHEVAAEPSDLTIEKARYSAFYGTSLEIELRARRIERVVVAGVTTSMCVDTTVRDLGQRDIDVLVVGEACADFDGPRHDAALAAMEFGFARIVSAGQAIEAFEGKFDD